MGYFVTLTSVLTFMWLPKDCPISKIILLLTLGLAIVLLTALDSKSTSLSKARYFKYCFVILNRSLNLAMNLPS